MAATYHQLSPSGLYWCDKGYNNWVNYDEVNVNLLNSTLLKLSGILDVDDSGISDGQVLRYNNGTSMFEPFSIPGGYRLLTTTTSTTSTTTTSTTSTTTTT